MIAIRFSLMAVADRAGPAPPKLGWPAFWPCSTGGQPDTNDGLQFEQYASLTSTEAIPPLTPVVGLMGVTLKSVSLAVQRTRG